MVLRVVQSLYKIVTVSYSTRRKLVTVMEVPKVYLNWESESKRFDAKMLFNHPRLSYSKVFNFERKSDEPVGMFLDKMKHNIEKDIQKVVSRKNKKSKEGSPVPVDSDDVEITVLLTTANGSPVAQKATCHDVFFGDNAISDLEFRICGLAYRVVTNSPTVVRLKLPSCAMVGFPVLPLKVDMKFGSIDQSEFRWYKTPLNSADKTGFLSQWEPVGKNTLLFTPSPSELDHRLKLCIVPGNGRATGKQVNCIFFNPVQAPPPGKCLFENRHAFTSTRLQSDSFRVVSYNILADHLALTTAANEELYPYCPQYARVWDYRRQLIIKELLGYNSDIICLQEVDTKIYANGACDLNLVLEQDGFEGHHLKKNGKKGRSEGIATYFRKDKFRFVDYLTCPLGAGCDKEPMFTGIWKVIQGNECLVERLQSVTTIAQVLVLESLVNENEILVVSNTHLYFHPDADHIRLLQGGLLFTFLEHVVQTVSSKNPKARVSLLSCGDFNSVPECGIYQLATSNAVPSDHIDWKSNAREEITGLSLSQPFVMGSACGTPEFTNYTVGFAACLDYIYYETKNLKVIQEVPFPSLEELKAHVALPSVVAPSDHVAVVADLTWV